MTKLDVIVQNLTELKESYEQAKANNELDEINWWVNEYGSYLTDFIDCHPVFKDSKPCLLDKYKIDYEDHVKRNDACAECKAIWLMEEWE